MAPVLDRLVICCRERLLRLMCFSSKGESVEVLLVEGGLQRLRSYCCFVTYSLQRTERSPAIVPEGQGPGVTNLIVLSSTGARARSVRS